MESPKIDRSEVDSEDLAETFMLHRSGRAAIRLNGRIVQWDSSRHKRLYVEDEWIPVKELVNHLTDHEIIELQNLPDWTGNNEHIISGIVLTNVSQAIDRYRFRASKGRHADPGRDAYEFEKLQKCVCRKCLANAD